MSMHFLLAPDKFRGSLAAEQVCHAMQEGIALALPDATTTALPLADGGEGTAEVLTAATNGRWVRELTTDPLQRPLTAGFGLSGSGRTGYVELAQASGLSWLNVPERNPLHTTTYGTGSLIQGAINEGVETIVLCIGGSATTDGGVGMAAALGWQFLDVAGTPFLPTGGTLQQIQTIVPPASPLPVRVRVACDVQNPLYGPEGAAFVYAPQKGASPADVALLDAGLQHLAQLVERQLSHDYAHVLPNRPGAGAAGGAGFGAMAFLGATLEPGIDLVLDVVGFDAQLARASVVLTGEGKLDAQTLQGKLLAGICRRAASHNVPVIALCGTLDLTPAQIQALGLQAAFSVLNAPQSLEKAVSNAHDDLHRATFNVVRLLTNHVSIRL
jgi:glycerate 2-kinase